MPVFKFYLQLSLKKFFPVQNPNNILVTTWQIIIALLSICSFVYYPTLISFLSMSFQKDLQDFWIFTLFLEIIFVFDIILKFNIGFMSMGVKYMKRKQIANYYLKNLFIFDFLSLIGLFSLRVVKKGEISTLITFLLFFKLKHINQIIKKIQKLTLLSQR